MDRFDFASSIIELDVCCLETETELRGKIDLLPNKLIAEKCQIRAKAV